MPIHDSRQQQQQNNNNKSDQVYSSSSSCRPANNVPRRSNTNHTSGIDSGINRKSADASDYSVGLNKSSLISSNRQANDGSSASAMSNLSSDYYIDDDHIDDQETINVGNLIIDLESDLEKEKIENEQQANAKPSTCTTTTTTARTSTSAATSSSSNHSSSSNKSSASSTANTPTFNTKGNKASSSTGNISSIGSACGKSNQKSSGKNIVNTVNNSALDNSINVINSSNNNNGHSVSSRAVFKSSSDERGELKMRITRETMPGKSEHKIVTSPNQKSPTSSSNSGYSNANVSSAYQNSYDEALMQKSPPSKPSQSSSISTTKECGTSTSIGTITEPECLGPCEPGTSVTLEGIVWQETDGGILVVNVTWRGKTYVGALLDCTKHDWAPPRLCDSPASDIDSRTSKGVRTKRIVTRSNGVGLDEKNLLQTTSKLRNGKGRRILTPSDSASCPKRQRDSEKPNENIGNQPETAGTSNVSSNINSENISSVPMNIDTALNDSISTSNMTSDKTGPNSPMLIGCNEPNCSKKYRNMNGLLYHQTHAHNNDNDSSNSAQENNCSSSIKTKDTLKDDPSDEISSPIEPKASSSPLAETKHEQEVQKHPTQSDSQLEHSIDNRNICKEAAPDMSINANLAANQEIRPPAKNLELERRNSSNSGHHLSDFGRKSPSNSRHSADHAPGPGTTHSSSSKQGTIGASKQLISAPMPPTTEEGMKPSGTSTGPPPAPHQANCYFNPAFLANNFNPYLSPYFPRMPIPPMYDGLAPATSSAFLSRFMSNVRPPLPPTSDSPSRLLSPSVPKNLPFPPFKIDPGLPIPNPQMTNPVSLPAISPMTHPPPLVGGSPHLRMPSQGDQLMPPTSQAPIPPPPNLNPLLSLSGTMNPMGPLGGPQVPSLVDDTLAKQFPRRFN